MFPSLRRRPAVYATITAIAGGLAAAGFALHAMAAGEPGTDRIKESLQKMLGGRAEVKSVGKTPVPGLFEANIGGQVVYTDATGRYILNGEMIDTRTGTNLTEERLAEINRIKWSDLPLARAIKWSKGDGSRQIAVFSDPNCGYCKRIEQTFQQMDNITVYTFLYPVLSPDSETKSRQVWCAADRTKAWRDWMLKQVALTGNGSCKTPLEENLALGHSMNVTGTPAVFFTDGTRIPGAADVATLERKLASIKK
ncbi:DsbC family protein [Cupriavidus taiwanensis]|uniref:Thiol:disulfide interchange protein n=1 Tax=Cupriavidus taiwanensis TaxID=164546 RepID=A0A375DDP8_9BURK|nr:DsbC family protein [Cupriavidus taiwanensis]SOY89490.1 putative THIOL:DISULFIDE INTERCHANGE PROTEIN [Cupriavidus taiwanensis]SOZ03377.1 putative THIOL:DISULFIDE INTERCHANGE PROTEIN [Cupriavidus taiwanensis]SOZ08885.1 putative THIOL:DISULFIDE INTERCHANGE PROTEIN [Cupriavidus taiwanensis]SPC07166.1 putative THIOL:DISULFIDE INTERCHANGE PROTEIN [Cupriavidus taiwanensis]SPC11277.1 putative thiol:disulfide interchange protein DsbC [Cupriavidus taiwanensis]